MDYKPKLLPDKPLTADNEHEDEFGHPTLAADLEEIVRNCPTPFTIGLFGKWGTGKTTIINLLKARLPKQEVAFATVDAWKYEGDSLRRQFLIALDEQLYLKKDYAQKLNQTLTESDPTRGPLRFDKGVLLNRYSLIGLALVGIGLFILIFVEGVEWLRVGTTSFVFGIATFALRVIFEMVKRVELTVTEHRTDSAEGFERIFRDEILKHDKLRNKRLLIIVDNLDRCSHEKAVELLSTIKTFLAIESETSANRCVFLIACDDDAIKRHIESSFLRDKIPQGDGPFDSEEFLRKFFNVSLRIPPFFETELQAYTEKLLKHTGLPELDSPDIATVIENAFRDNPRQIKQFINTLLATFLLAKRREEASPALIEPKGTVTDHAPFLAKILVIRQLFQDIFQLMKEGSTIDEVEAYVFDEPKKSKHLIRVGAFLDATRSIRRSENRPFIYLKQTAEELQVPRFPELLRALGANKAEDVSDVIRPIKDDKDRVKLLERAIRNLLAKNAGKPLLVRNIVAASLTGLRKCGVELSRGFYNDVAVLLMTRGVLEGELRTIEPPLIYEEVLPRCESWSRNQVISKYLRLIDPKDEGKPVELPDDEWSAKVFTALLARRQWAVEHREDIQGALSNRYAQNVKVLSIFKNRVEDVTDFVAPEVPGKLAEAVTESDITDTKLLAEKTSVLIACEDVANGGTISRLLNMYNFHLRKAIERPHDEDTINILKYATDVFLTYRGHLEAMGDQETLNSFADTVTEGAARGDWSQRTVWVPLSLLLSDVVPEAKKGGVETRVQEFIKGADLENIDDVLSWLKPKARKELVMKYEATVRARVMLDQPFFNRVYKLASPEIRTEWLKSLIDSDRYAWALEKLEEIGVKVDDPVAIVQKLLERAEAIPVQDRERFYRAINELKCGQDSEQEDILVKQVIKLLKDLDQDNQKLGAEILKGAGYLSDLKKTDILREVVQWLYRDVPVSESYQPYAIGSIVSNYDRLQSLPAVRVEFEDFIMDKLVRRSNSREGMVLGLKMMGDTLSAVFDTHTGHYEGLSERMSQETNPEIRTELLRGLKALRPPPEGMSAREKEYWKKVEKVGSEESGES